MVIHPGTEQIFLGAVTAIWYNNGQHRKEQPTFFWKLLHWKFLPILIGITLYILEPLATKNMHKEAALVTPMVQGVCVSLLLLWLLFNPKAKLGDVLNVQPLVALGILSYSLYLWQQPATQCANRIVSENFLLIVLLSFAAALMSYFLVERPARAFLRRYWKIS